MNRNTLAAIAFALALVGPSGPAQAQDFFLADSVTQVAGLDGVENAAWSPDSRHLYTVSSIDSAVTLLSLDASGNLTIDQILMNGVDGLTGLQGANGVAVSPDGRHVYVAARDDSALSVFSRDENSGELTFVESIFDDTDGVDGLRQAWSVAVAPDGSAVYATGREDDAVASFARDANTGALTFVDVDIDRSGVVSGMFRPEAVAVSPDGNHVYVASNADDAVVVFAVDGPTGSLDFLEFWEAPGFFGQDENDVEGLNGASEVLVSPDGLNVYVAARSGDAIVTFDRVPSTGLLTPTDLVENDVDGATGLDGVVDLAVAGDRVYAVAVSDHLTTYARDATTGALTQISDIEDGVGGVEGLDFVGSVTVSPDGAYLTTTSVRDDAVGHFERDTLSGNLVFIEARRDDLGTIAGLNDVRALAVSPGGRNLYSAGFGDDAIGVFALDRDSYQLEFLEYQINGANGVLGLGGVTELAVSPDRQHLYAVGSNDDAVVVFRRSGERGQLSFVEAFTGEPNSPVTGLSVPVDVAISDDGAFVYVAGRGDGAISSFSRDPDTGSLSPLDRIDDIPGLSSVSSITLGGEGHFMFGVSPFGNDIVVLERDPVSGLISLPAGSAQSGATLKSGGSSTQELGAFELNIDGELVLFIVANRTSPNEVVIYRIGPGGERTEVASIPGATATDLSDSPLVSEGIIFFFTELFGPTPGFSTKEFASVSFDGEVLSDSMPAFSFSDLPVLNQTLTGNQLQAPAATFGVGSDNALVTISQEITDPPEPYADAYVWSALSGVTAAGGARQVIEVGSVTVPPRSLDIQLTAQLPQLPENASWVCVEVSTIDVPAPTPCSSGSPSGAGPIAEQFTLTAFTRRTYIVDYPRDASFPFRFKANIVLSPDAVAVNNEHKFVVLNDGDRIFKTGFESTREL
ncbi:MAG: beta-propeller fold lactonase family protein [Pseudomonadota bacterium]